MSALTFEEFDEQCIFDCYDYFFYHKYTHRHKDCKVVVNSFADAVGSEQSHFHGDIRHLRQEQNDHTTPDASRLVAINVGQNLVSLCFTSNKLTDRVVETVCGHLSSIRYLQFDGTRIGSNAIKSISKFCGRTLISLRVRGCHNISSESCGWIAGAIGHNTPRLKKLKALDLSGTNVDDRGLEFLSKGLIQYLDLERCGRLTDRGVGRIVSASSFSYMKVLNLRGCTSIGDSAVVALTQVMTKMMHLNLSQCGSITNKAATSIGNLLELETLSLEGAYAVNDLGLGRVCERTKLNLLNVTGCSISRKSLLLVINTMGYVRECEHFFGFMIRSSDAKVSALHHQTAGSLHNERNQAARAVQGIWGQRRSTMLEIRAFEERKRHKAASIIQMHLLTCMSRRRFGTLWHAGCVRRMSIRLQRLARGYLARQKFKSLLAQYRRETHYAVLVQKHFRGNSVRAGDKVVLQAVLQLRAKRLHEKRTAAAIAIQCFYRQLMAMDKRQFLQRCMVERTNASIIVQVYTRRMLAQKLRHRKRLFADLRYCYRTMMSLKIQCFLRQCAARKELRKRFSLSLHRLLTEHAAARRIQSRYRGILERKGNNAIRLIKNTAATNIQRVYRSSQVQHWKKIKWNLLSHHLWQRAAKEIDEAKNRQKPNSPQRIQTLNDEKDLFFSGIQKNSSMEILIHAFGKTYMELRCLIYWSADGLYRPCTIRGYDERMRLWKVDYDEDDNEWLDLVREKDRVMVNNGSCYEPFNQYCTPQLKAYLTQRDMIQASTTNQDEPKYLQFDASRQRDNLACSSQKNTINPQQSSGKTSRPQRHEEENAFQCDLTTQNFEKESADQCDIAPSNAHQCDLWMSAYIARGLLDQYYDSRTKDSLQKLIGSHVVKALTVSIGSVKTRNSDIDLLHFEELLREIESIIASASNLYRN